MLRRRALIGVIVAILGIAGAVVGMGAVGGSMAAGRSARASQGAHSARRFGTIEMTPAARANQRAAVRDARWLLGRLLLPSGAQRSPTDPAGESGLEAAWERPGTAALVDRHRWWIVPGEPEAVLAYIESHPSPGSRRGVRGTSSGPRGMTWVVGYDWPAVRGVLQTRSLLVEVVALPGGRTGVRADAQETWVVPKPSSDLIPSAARVLELSVGRPWASEGKPPETTLSMTVTEAAKVQAITDAINRMALLQPGIWHCPRIPSDGAVATFKFLASAGGTVVATASMPAYSRTEISSCYALKLALPELGKSVELAELQPNEDSIVTLAEKVLGVPVYTSEERHRIEPTTSPPPATGTGTATGTSTTTGTGTGTTTGTTGTGTQPAPRLGNRHGDGHGRGNRHGHYARHADHPSQCVVDRVGDGVAARSPTPDKYRIGPDYPL